MSETYYHLSVGIEQNTSLTYCLKKYISKELLKNKDKFYCSKCNSLQEAEQQVKLETLPKVLVIQLKRFKVINNFQKKLLYAVNIPSEIQLDFLLKDKGKYKQSSLYNLRSIVVHLGSGNDFGHYISLIKKGDKWFIFNDEKVEVRLFTDQQVLKSDLSEFFGSPNENYENQSSQCAYLLFYELVE